MTKIGVLSFQNNIIVVGVRWKGARLRIVNAGSLVHIFHGQTLVRSVALHPGCDYYALGTPKHGRSKKAVS